MKKEIIASLIKQFEEVTYQEHGCEYWMARDLQELLGYKEWRNFTKVIKKAVTVHPPIKKIIFF